MKFTDLTMLIECNRCCAKDKHTEVGAVEDFESKGWTSHEDFGTLCPRCSNIEANITADKLEELEVIYDYLGESHQNDSIYKHRCPSCRKEVSLYGSNIHKICSGCGQRIWGNYEP
jgi:hypothetical protein